MLRGKCSAHIHGKKVFKYNVAIFLIEIYLIETQIGVHKYYVFVGDKNKNNNMAWDLLFPRRQLGSQGRNHASAAKTPSG